MRALLAPAPHGGHRPSALTEVGYREPGPGRRWRNERARAALTRGPRQPEIGRPASERQPQKGRPVISMREDPDPVVGPHVRTPACAGPPHHDASSTQSESSGHQVPSQCACAATVPGPRCLQQRCTCSGTNEAQKPVPYCRLADSVGASRTSGNASYRLCAQIKDERSVRWCNRLEWNRLASFVEDPSIECGQPRHACCDEAAQRLLESRKGHSTGGVRPWLGTAVACEPRR